MNKKNHKHVTPITRATAVSAKKAEQAISLAKAKEALEIQGFFAAEAARKARAAELAKQLDAQNRAEAAVRREQASKLFVKVSVKVVKTAAETKAEQVAATRIINLKKANVAKSANAALRKELAAVTAAGGGTLSNGMRITIK